MTGGVGGAAAGRDATILHADLDCFFAAVEQRDNPELRGRPVAVGGGVVLAASYEARAFGVRGAMGGREARRRCPDLVVVPPRMGAYSEASRAVFEVFDDVTPYVEAISIDEAFLEVGGLRRIAGTPLQIGARLRADVKERVGLPITVGIARTKFLAKVASGSAKPDGLLLVAPDRELEFLHPLPIERMWGVGPATSAKLHARGITTVADLAAAPEAALVAILGPHAGRHLHALALNRDPRPVRRAGRRRSVGAQRSLGWSDHTDAELDATLVSLTDRVARRLRAADRVARTVVLRVRFDDFSRITRSHSFAHATDETALVVDAARSLLGQVVTSDDRRITLIGLTLSNLEAAGAVQLRLPLDRRPGCRLDSVIDAVQEKYGLNALGRAVHLDHDHGIAMPLLPEPPNRADRDHRPSPGSGGVR